ncbi:MAG: hypothetical protein PVG33_18550 [Chloroflexota bacterium]|jgi:hypothetical protein
MTSGFRELEINGGQVNEDRGWRLWLEPIQDGYADAQIDDYGGRKRSEYAWRPGTQLTLKARFSHDAGQLVGTAGFGFWNAPFGDPTVHWPALPRAAWFFYASSPSDLPFPEEGPGRGWFAGTLNASGTRALALAPLALPVLVANNVLALRRHIWPRIRRQLGISFALVPASMVEWHRYDLAWRDDGCRFYVDGELLLEAPHKPTGPLGFVCWLDNQYMVATPNGRLRWGTRPCPEPQWLEIEDLQLERQGSRF